MAKKKKFRSVEEILREYIANYEAQEQHDISHESESLSEEELGERLGKGLLSVFKERMVLATATDGTRR